MGYILKNHPDQPWDVVCVNASDVGQYTMTVWYRPWRKPRYQLTSSSLTDVLPMEKGGDETPTVETPTVETPAEPSDEAPVSPESESFLEAALFGGLAVLVVIGIGAVVYRCAPSRQQK